MNKFLKSFSIIALAFLISASAAKAVSILSVQQGGTGVGTITGIVKGNGTSAFTGLTGTTNQISYWIDANTIGALTTATYPSLTELSYVKGVTSAIQTQLDTKTTGSGTTNKVPKWTGSTALGDSRLFDDGTFVGSTGMYNDFGITYRMEIFTDYGGDGGEVPANTVLFGGRDNNVNAFIIAGLQSVGGTSKIGGLYWNGSAYKSAWEIANTTGAGNFLLMKGGGNVGIGTSTPGQKLEIAGNLLLKTSGNIYSILNPTGANDQAAYIFQKNGSTKWQFGMDFATSGTADFYIYDQVNTTARMYISGGNTYLGANAVTGSGITVLSSGNVGIANGSPSYALDVIGDINASGNLISGSLVYAPSAVLFGTTGSNSKIQESSTGHLDFLNRDNTDWINVKLKNLEITGKDTLYKGITTTGWGVPAIYGTGRSSAQTAAVASVATYTVGAADGSFLVSANILVTTATLHSFTATVTYTDEGNTSRTVTMQFSTIAGAFVTAMTNAQGTVPYEGVPLHIRAKASTAITIATTGTFTTVTYNVEGSIMQIN